MTNVANIISQLQSHYDAAHARLRQAISEFANGGTLPPSDAIEKRLFSYPELRITYRGEERKHSGGLSFGRIDRPGVYTTTITRPDLFAGYLEEQLVLIEKYFDVDISVGPGDQQIPFPYVLEGGADALPAGISTADLARHFPTTELAHIGDEIADGLFDVGPDADLPLALFDALRTDFSLARLKHYSGTAPEHFQRYILFTNYHRYVDEFVSWAAGQIGKNGYTALAGAGGLYIDTPGVDTSQPVADSAWRKHQMPAYHLIGPNRTGITLVNIGVGPSNAKTICDHLAVLRPEAWLMIGHCGGLRSTQRIGDYVLAHAYLRDDHIMDDVLPPEIPIPPIAEVQQALAAAAEQVSGESGADLKRRMRTGTIVTTDDRNWELRYSQSALRFSQSRAVGIDMESATIAAQGLRFRVPYGTLLCVSDKPLHGEIKLPGQANQFYEEAIAAHLQIGIRTCEMLRDEGARLHSRKLRAFNEPPFR